MGVHAKTPDNLAFAPLHPFMPWPSRRCLLVARSNFHSTKLTFVARPVALAMCWPWLCVWPRPTSADTEISSHCMAVLHLTLQNLALPHLTRIGCERNHATEILTYRSPAKTATTLAATTLAGNTLGEICRNWLEYLSPLFCDWV